MQDNIATKTWRKLEQQAPDLQVLEVLGQGAFGIVFKVQWRDDLSISAVKVLLNGTSEAGTRFQREVRLLDGQGNNPHVVGLHGYDLTGELPWIAMEFCPGGALDAWTDSPRPWETVATALLHAAVGLKGIHDVGGYHRDIKPANLLVAYKSDRAPLIKLADFGVARVPSTAPTSPLTRTPWGTEGYCAPEVREGRVGPASDIYSLGKSGMELMTGSLLLEELEKVLIPQRLRTLLLAMVDQRVAQRPTCDQVIAELRAILQQAQVVPQRPQDVAVARRGRPKAVGGNIAAGLLLGAVVFGGALLIAKALEEG